jgi:hypothetical protein
MNEAGKGDKRRPTDEQRFRENFDLIFGKKDEKTSKEHPASKDATGRPKDSERVSG